MERGKSGGIEFDVGSVTVALRVHAPHVVRVSLGARALSAPSSYLTGQVNNKLPTMERGTSPVSLRLGELSVEIDPSSQQLIFSDSAGRRQMRLAIDRLALLPRVRLLLGTVGEQHFYGLGEGGHQFDRLGVTRRLWNFQANRGQGADIAVPLLVSQSGYAVFIDNSASAAHSTPPMYCRCCRISSRSFSSNSARGRRSAVFPSCWCSPSPLPM
jgi:alpha-glucosidase (family GH31 glycosyl hydrolase)